MCMLVASQRVQYQCDYVRVLNKAGEDYPEIYIEDAKEILASAHQDCLVSFLKDDEIEEMQGLE